MTDLIQLAGITLGATASSREEAVAQCGSKLLELGAVRSEYVAAMWEREQIFSSALGSGFAIPHGTDESRKYINFDQLVITRFHEEIPWDDEQVKFCIGIAAAGDSHMEILGNLADLIQDSTSEKVLMESTDANEILSLLLATESE